MRTTLSSLFLFTLIFIFTNSFSQSTEIRAVDIKAEGDRSLNRAMKILQDSTGLIWISEWPSVNSSIGSRLLSYDGFETKEIEKAGANIEEVKIIGQSRDGLMYIVGSKLAIYDPYKRKIVQTFTLNINSSTALKNAGKIIYAFGEYPDKLFAVVQGDKSPNDIQYHIVKANGNGNLGYIASLNCNSNEYFKVAVSVENGFYALDRKKIIQFDYKGNKLNEYKVQMEDYLELHSIYKNEQGHIFVMARNSEEGTNFSDKKNLQLFLKKTSDSVFKNVDLPKEAVKQKFVRLAIYDSELWLIGSEFYIARYDIKNKNYEVFTEELKNKLPDMEFYFLANQFYSLFKDESGAYWLSSMEGLIKFSLLPQELTIFLRDDPSCIDERCSIRGVCEDKNGNLFISYQDGLKLMPSGEKRIIDIPIDLEREEFGGFYSLSTYDDFLFWSDKILNLKTGKIQTLLPNKKNQRIIHYLDTVDQKLWLMEDKSFENLYSFSLKSQELEIIPLNLKHLRESETHQIQIKKPENHIIILTGEKFVIVDKKGKTVKDIGKSFVTNNNTSTGITCFKLVNDRYIWAASFMSNSIFRIDLEKDSMNYELNLSESNEPFQTNFYSMTFSPDNRSIWFGLNDGLGRLDIEGEKFQKFTEIPVLNSLEFNRPSALQDSKGILWFGSTFGLISFDPNELLKQETNRKEYKVVFSSFDYFDAGSGVWKRNNLLSPGKSRIDLAHNQNSIIIEFFIPNYLSTDKLHFSHWLEGFEPDFSSAKRISNLEYSNLPPGDYVLHLRGGSGIDLPESSERTLSIHISQAWYKTYWAFSAYLLIFLALTYSLYRFQINRLKEKEDAKYLKELDQFKTGFFTNITHEFRTPLTVILGLASEIKENSKISEQIRRNGLRLLNLINQILDLSKLEEGKLKVEYQKVELVQFSKYLVDSFKTLANTKDVEMVFTSEISELEMDVDEEKYQVILANLLSNAIKFSPNKGNICVHLKKNSNEIIMSVKDDGPGIPEDELEKVFDRFYQVEGNKKIKVGSGVGLALSKEFVRIMAGNIKASNRPNGGAIFEVSLPIKNEASVTKKEIKAILPTVVFEPENQDALNEDILDIDKPIILVVEDEPDVRSYIKRCLINDFAIVEAINGEEGFAKTIEYIPDLLISDVMMPKIDGLELTEKVKNDKRTSHIPVIILSAKTSLASRLDGLKRGAEVYLAKPFEKEELLLQINNLFSLRTKIQSYLNDSGTKDLPEEVHKEEHHFISSLKTHLDENLDNSQFGVEQLCELSAMSRTQLHRKLVALTGMSTTKFINSYKLSKACEMLLEDRFNISEIAYSLGYSDPNYFTRLFQKTYGKSPSEFKNIKKNYLS